MEVLTKKEEEFLVYWAKERQDKKKFYRKLSLGLPMGVMIVVAVMINFLSGWYQKADMVIHQDTSVIFVVLIACIAIVVFISMFSVRHRWDLNEVRYKELLWKKETAENMQRNQEK